MTVQLSPTRPPRAEDPFPRWKRALAHVGWDALFIVTAFGLILVGLVVGVALAAILAAVAAPLHLTGVVGAAVGLIAIAGFVVPLVAFPILGVRRLRRAFPRELFPEPPPEPGHRSRRSRGAILADVARLDATLARTAPPPPDRYDGSGPPGSGPPGSGAAGARAADEPPPSVGA